MQLQGAEEMAADEAMDGPGADAEDCAPGVGDADRAAEVTDVPSSSCREGSQLPVVAETVRKRTALPAHAKMVAELQVRPSQSS